MTRPSPLPIPRRALAGLAGLFVLAVVLRAIGLGSGLWFDEMVGLVRAYREPLAVSLTTFQGDFHHPLYSVLARLSLVAFGDTAWAIRLPALVFGAATVPLIWLLGREVASDRDAWLSAIFLTVFYPHVWFSQNARGYTMLAFFSTLAAWILIRYLRRPAARRPSFAYAAAAAVGVYAHLTMVFLAVGHAGVCLVEGIRARWTPARWIGTALTFGLAAAFTVVLYAAFLTQVIDFFLNKPSQLVGVSTPLWAIQETIRVARQGLGVGSMLGVLGAAVLFCIGMVSYARRSGLVLALFLAPGVVTVLGASLARGTMYPRFFFFMVAFLVLILIRGTLVVGDGLAVRLARSGRPLPVGPALVGLMVLASLVGLGYNYRYPKQDYEGAIAYVEAQAADTDTIATTGDGAWPLLDVHHRDYALVETAEDIRALRERGGSLWMVFTFPLYIEAAAPDVMDAIDAGCGDEAVFPGTIGGGDLIVCRFPPLDQEG